ncbi:hypothetical protein ACF0H5_011258 [Mactra antiquata]
MALTSAFSSSLHMAKFSIDTSFNLNFNWPKKYVFMNVGGNFFNDMTTTHEVYMDIVRNVEDLHAACVQKIFIASIIERGHCPKFTGSKDSTR